MYTFNLNIKLYINQYNLVFIFFLKPFLKAGSNVSQAELKLKYKYKFKLNINPNINMKF